MEDRKDTFDRQLGGHEYMSRKKRKQDLESAQVPKRSQLFSGMVFYVNGYTRPSMQELRVMMEEHGGKMVYQHTGEVTHLITNQLSQTKWNELRHKDRALRPEWVVDSIKAMKLAPYYRYDIRSRRTGASEDHGVDEDDYDDDGYDEEEKDGDALGGPQLSIVRQSSSSTAAVSCKDGARFLRQYFENSRLHHLSAWKAAFQEEICEELFSSQSPQSWLGSDGNPNRIILHVDMDCFFASVAVRENPSLAGKPIAVSHSDNDGEVSACSYEAKARGVKAGMFVSSARKLCPELITVRYQFDVYEEVSREFFSILRGCTEHIEVISCEEAFLDVTETHALMGENLEELNVEERALRIAKILRSEIAERTRCTASIGIAHNMLLARMATEKAKPNNIFIVTPRTCVAFMASLAVESLPGVGWKKLRMLKDMGVVMCTDLLEVEQWKVEQKFGQKNGRKMIDYAQGLCHREVTVLGHRKSISLEVNSGIRFDSMQEMLVFIEHLARELSRRLKDRKGTKLVVHVMKKRPNWEEPTKYLGHGSADSFSKTKPLNEGTNEVSKIALAAKDLYRQFGIRDTTEVVGIGLAMKGLDPVSLPQRAASISAKREAATSVSKPLTFFGEEHFQESQQTLSQLQASKPGGEKKRSNPYVRVSKDDVDHDFLAELPASIRNELLDEMQPAKVQPMAKSFFKAGPLAVAKKSKRDDVDDDVYAQLPEDVRRDVHRGTAFGDVSKVKATSLFSAPAPPPAVVQARLAKQKAQPENMGTASSSTKIAHSSYVTMKSSQVDWATLVEALGEEGAKVYMEEEVAQAEQTQRKVSGGPSKGSKRVAVVMPVQEQQPSAVSSIRTTVARPELRLVDLGFVFASNGKRFISWRETCRRHLHGIPIDKDGMSPLVCELLWQYVRQCVMDERNMEDAYMFVSDLRAFCASSGNPLWVDVFNKVLDLAQQAVFGTYGDGWDLEMIA